MNICMCGAEDGYPHDPLCPYPYFGRNVKLEENWIRAYREKKAGIEQTQPIRVTGEVSQLIQGK